VRCLLVDDDQSIRGLLVDYLRPFGYQVDVVSDGAGMRFYLQDHLPDVVLLDLMLPDESGLDLCQWAKRQWPSLPVVMLTAQGDTPSRVLGLELGADDYVPKPFEPRELVARMKAVLRRGSEQAGSTPVAGLWPQTLVKFSGWTFDRVARQLKAPDGLVVVLSAAEFRLLSALVDHPHQVLSRDKLLDLTRAPGVEVSERSVDLSVSRLRAKLRDTGQQSELIRTLRGAGYIFTGKLQS